MADEIKVKIPDIGGATNVDVIELLVKSGDQIDVDTPLLTLESEKASMDIPSPFAGKVGEWLVKVGDKVSEGDAILTLLGESLSQESSKEKEVEPSSSPKEAAPAAKAPEEAPASPSKDVPASQTKDIFIPDIGGATNVDVIEIMVKEGDVVSQEQSLLTLEGDKATMDIPSPYEGEVEKVHLKIGDKISQGTLILSMKIKGTEEIPAPATKAKEPEKVAVSQAPSTPPPPVSLLKSEPETALTPSIAAGPAVRRMARELGVNLNDVKGSGRKNRILKEDIDAYVKARLSEKPSNLGFALPQAPVIDFSQFGTIETQPLNKIKRLTGKNVHRSWVTIPHVTQFDEADITELEAFRKQESERAKQEGYKLTVLAFVTRAVIKALMQYPQFNASLDVSGENLIYKKYYNIGIAVETPNGLVVPVIKNADRLSVSDIAREMGALSMKARDKGLMPADMSGGCFTISSLGGIGGTAFTPIVNSPEVAILGLSRSSIKPVYQNSEFKPRLMLPLSLSYDHRVIDGAEAARFTVYLSELLSDVRRILL